MPTIRQTITATVQLALASALLAVAAGIALPQSAKALSGSDFKAGRIIDDEIFNNANAMSSGQIQDFLNAKMPSCDTWGTESYAGTTRRAYSEGKGIKFPLTCLKDYYENPTTHANNLTTTDGQAAPIPSGAKSAAQIIYDVGQQYSINPQVLLVLLQKEQALVQDDWPWPIQYRSATGFGCPDTAACDSTYNGFYNQVSNAARQFRRYAQYPNSYGHVSGINNSVRYNPDSGCGSSTVFIENQSTASLYNYTPYQPNAAALANLYGSGDGCSAYGNRNFWRYFTEWFGSTRAADANRVFNLKKSELGSTQELFTATYTQLTMHSWWSGSGGIHHDVISTAPDGERILGFDIATEPDGTTQAAYIATSSGVYKVTWNGSTYGTPTKIISLSGANKVVFDKKQEGANTTYRLYVLANDGPYEYWWRSGTGLSDGYRFWNINNGIDLVKSTGPDGKDQVFVATNGNVYMMRWPVNSDVERRLVNSLTDTVAIDKQTLGDGTELLYTATKSGVHETWWNQTKPAGWFSNPAKIAYAHSGEVVKDIQKTITNGYHQLYVMEGNGVWEYWWGNGQGVHSGKLIDIPQDDATRIEKTASGSYQNLYTAQQSFVYETWWGNGKFGNGPAIVNLNQ